MSFLSFLQPAFACVIYSNDVWTIIVFVVLVGIVLEVTSILLRAFHCLGNDEEYFLMFNFFSILL